MPSVYMLDTNICSYIMRERPQAVLERLQRAVEAQDEITVSVITYYEMLLGTIGRKASPRHAHLVETFVARLSAIIPWDAEAAMAATQLRKELSEKGTSIGNNDTMIAGHALAANCVLVTNNLREFSRVSGLEIENWAV